MRAELKSVGISAESMSGTGGRARSGASCARSGSASWIAGAVPISSATRATPVGAVAGTGSGWAAGAGVRRGAVGFGSVGFGCGRIRLCRCCAGRLGPGLCGLALRLRYCVGSDGGGSGHTALSHEMLAGQLRDELCVDARELALGGRAQCCFNEVIDESRYAPAQLVQHLRHVVGEHPVIVAAGQPETVFEIGEHFACAEGQHIEFAGAYAAPAALAPGPAAAHAVGRCRAGQPGHRDRRCHLPSSGLRSRSGRLPRYDRHPPRRCTRRGRIAPCARALRGMRVPSGSYSPADFRCPCARAGNPGPRRAATVPAACGLLPCC